MRAVSCSISSLHSNSIHSSTHARVGNTNMRSSTTRSVARSLHSPSSSSSATGSGSASAASVVTRSISSDGTINYQISIERVRHGSHANASLATTLQQSGSALPSIASSSSSSPSPPSSVAPSFSSSIASLTAYRNAIILPAMALLQASIHAGQFVWVRSAGGVESNECPRFQTLCQVWSLDKTARTGSRLLLSSHVSSPLSDGCMVELTTLDQPILKATSISVCPTASNHRLSDPQSSGALTANSAASRGLHSANLKRHFSNILATILTNRHVYIGMEVSVSLFDEDFGFEVCDIQPNVTIGNAGAGTYSNQSAKGTSDKATTSTTSSSSSVPSNGSSSNPQLYQLDAIPRVSIVNRESLLASTTAPFDTNQQHSFRVSAESMIDASGIGGLDAEIASLHDLLSVPLLQPHLFRDFGLKPPKGVLLYGAPGVGKTMIARAVAQQAFASFYVVNGPEIISKYVGESEEKLVQLFATARANTPSIIFLDEIDSLCPKRDESSDEIQKRIVAALLTLMDGLSSPSSESDGTGKAAADDRVMVIGATNRPDALDTALRRAGRFDREMEIAIPNEVKRLDILRKMLSKMPNTLTDQQVIQVSSVTHGYVGADLKALCREAALVALDRWQVEHPDWLQTIVSASNTTPADGTTASSPSSATASLHITHGDFTQALPLVKPSAMRSLIIDVPRVKWSDIGGQEDVKQKLKEAVEWPLMHPEAFIRLGIQPPKGILLYGPPGCSKTLMAKALATESSRNFIAVKGPELFSKYVGESEKAVKEIFRKARAAAPSIIFFDEIDSIAAKRNEGSSGEGGGERVAHRVLSQLLSELDGIESLRQVTILAATNRPDLIDPALLRPGRIDRILYVSPPDESSAKEILLIEFRRIGKAVESVDAGAVAKLCTGMSGAEISALCREAALVAMEEDIAAQQLTVSHFEKARNRIQPRINEAMLKFYKDYRERSSLISV